MQGGTYLRETLIGSKNREAQGIGRKAWVISNAIRSHGSWPICCYCTWHGPLDVFPSDVAAKRTRLYDLEQIQAKVVCMQTHRHAQTCDIQNVHTCKLFHSTHSPYLHQWPPQSWQWRPRSPWRTLAQLRWGLRRWRDLCRSSSPGSLRSGSGSPVGRGS